MERSSPRPKSATKPDIAEAAAKLRAAGVTLELGGHREETFLAQDLIVPSPGVPADNASFGGRARRTNSGLE